VIAAEQYASRLVVPSSQQHPALRWPSHKDQAAKALAKLAGSCLPASLKQLEKAIAKAKADYDKQLKTIETTIRTAVDKFDHQPEGPVDDLDGLVDDESYGDGGALGGE